MFDRIDGAKAQEKKVDAKLTEMMKLRNLVKALIATYPDYQIRKWCKTEEKELAGDIILDLMSYRDALPIEDKALVTENWKDALSMATREVATLVLNYGK